MGFLSSFASIVIFSGFLVSFYLQHFGFQVFRPEKLKNNSRYLFLNERGTKLSGVSQNYQSDSCPLEA